MDTTVRDTIRQVLQDQNLDGVDELHDDEDLFDAGMSSLTAVRVVLMLEERFDLLFPEESLTRERLGSITAIATLIETIGAAEPA
jgi:acyl carrier protein